MQYQLLITFNTDREVTPGELADLEGACIAQIDEPMTWTDEGDFIRADFTVSNTETAWVSKETNACKHCDATDSHNFGQCISCGEQDDALTA